MHVKDSFDSITVITTLQIHIHRGSRRGCDHMVVGFTTTYDYSVGNRL
jgi:hypothetical protein